MGIIEKFFEANKEEISKIHMIGLIGLTLIILKFTFRTEINEIIVDISKEVGQFSFLINIYKLLVGILFVWSVAAVIIAIIFTIIYLITSIIYEKIDIKSQRIIDIDEKAHRFFLGSKLVVLKINRYLIISLCYLYIFDTSMFIRYKDIILNLLSINKFSFIILGILIYGLFLIGALISLIRIIAYRFLYFESTKDWNWIE